MDLDHDYPACGKYRGGLCTCVVKDIIQDEYDLLSAIAEKRGWKIPPAKAQQGLQQDWIGFWKRCLKNDGPAKYEHQWDGAGEKCLKCGDKDWMGGPCSF